MQKELEEDGIVNVIGGDYSPKKKMAWDLYTNERIKKMKNNEPQLHAFNTILKAIRQEKPENKLFFVEGS